MRWLVSQEITWVYSLLIEMMSYVSYMRNQISKKTS